MNDVGGRKLCWNSTRHRWISIGDKIEYRPDHSRHPELTGMDHMTRSLQKQLQEDMMKRYRKHCLDYDYDTHVEKSALSVNTERNSHSRNWKTGSIETELSVYISVNDEIYLRRTRHSHMGRLRRPRPTAISI